MSVDITIRVPDALARRLQDIQDRLPEVLERGLLDVLAETSPRFSDENAVLGLLASRPAPEEVLAIRASAELQSRAGELLRRSKQDELNGTEAAELERLLMLEHLVRLAKAHAYRQLTNRA